MEWKIEWDGNFGMEYGRCQNGMEDFKNGMEDNLPYFHTKLHSPFCALCLQKNIYQCRVVINNVVTEVIQPQYLRVLFVDKSQFFGCLYCANSVRIASF